MVEEVRLTVKGVFAVNIQNQYLIPLIFITSKSAHTTYRMFSLSSGGGVSGLEFTSSRCAGRVALLADIRVILCASPCVFGARAIAIFRFAKRSLRSMAFEVKLPDKEG